MPDGVGARAGAAGAVALLTAAYVLSYVDRTIVGLLVGPIKADLVLTDTQFSLLGGLAFALFYSILGIPLAWVADRGDRRRLITVGIALWSVMTILCGLVPSFGWFFVARVGVGIGEAALSPSAYSLIAELYPAERVGRALAIYGSGVYLGIGLSFLAGGALVDALGGDWRTMFAIVGAPGLLLAALVAWRLPEARRGPAAVPQAPAPLAPHLKRDWRFLALHFAGFSMLTLAFNGYLAWLAEFLLRAFRWAKTDSGLAIGGIVLVAGIAGMLAGGAASDRLRARGDARGALTAALGGAVLLVPVPLILTTTGSAALSLAAFAPLVFLSAFCFGPAVVSLQLATPPPLRARVSAIYLLVVNLTGIGFGGTAVALVSDRLLADEGRLGQAMAVVGATALLLAVPLLAAARRLMPKENA
ncbi:MFS transporter [Novosphingobium sp. Gsoil 351]|uniref:spinster family MFS transporter n=1 Tax=Novosphingobium sp. Gsoil 351 TaxID=2675225 RepID=UPI0018A8356A|nr:MFS transporter [Novosphingobium sp. Gsoil 351]